METYSTQINVTGWKEVYNNSGLYAYRNKDYAYIVLNKTSCTYSKTTVTLSSNIGVTPRNIITCFGNQGHNVGLRIYNNQVELIIIDTAISNATVNITSPIFRSII